MLKKLDPKHIFKTVSLLDPAIDKKATGEKNLKKFEDTYELKLLKMKEGVEPTLFHIKNIGGSRQAEIQEEHYKIDMPDISELKNPKDIKNIKPTAKVEKTTTMLLKFFYAGCKKYQEGKDIFDVTEDLFEMGVAVELGSFIMGRTTMGDDEKNA